MQKLCTIGGRRASLGEGLSAVAYPEGFPEHIHNSFSPYKEWLIPYMVKMICEYAQETPLDTPL